jgi:hypothetical protein
MSEKRENLVSTILEDSIKFVAEIVILTAATFIFVFVLFAPFFAPYFEGKYQERYGYGNQSVILRMFFVKIVLWVICIAGWSVIAYLSLVPPAGCGFQP